VAVHNQRKLIFFFLFILRVKPKSVMTNDIWQRPSLTGCLSAVDQEVLCLVHNRKCHWSVHIYPSANIIQRQANPFRPYLCTIWGSNTSGYEEFYLLGYFGGTCHLHLQGRRISQARNEHTAGSKQSSMTVPCLAYSSNLAIFNGLHGTVFQEIELFFKIELLPWGIPIQIFCAFLVSCMVCIDRLPHRVIQGFAR
jgi:hypothetical protein